MRFTKVFGEKGRHGPLSLLGREVQGVELYLRAMTSCPLGTHRERWSSAQEDGTPGPCVTDPASPAPKSFVGVS